MASPHVRDWFIAKINALAPTAEFIETDGSQVPQKNLPAIWATLEFDIGSTQRLSIGRRYLEREFGTASVVFLIKSGKGPAVALNEAQVFAEACKDLYQEEITEALTGITGTARFDNVSPPNSEPYEDGNWLVCTVAIVYTYDRVRGPMP